MPNQNLGEMRFTNNANRKLLHFGKRNMDALVNEIIRDLVFPFIIFFWKYISRFNPS